MRFDVSLIDPPWLFQNEKTGGSFASGAGQVYEAEGDHGRGMALKEILALPIPSIMEPNHVMALWVPTALKFSHAEPCIRAWGLTYKTTWYWRKTRLGMGFWGRNMVEELLILIRGSVEPFRLQEPNVRESEAIDTVTLDQGETWITRPSVEHSAKPEEFRGMLERATKAFSRRHCVEVFARGQLQGDRYVAVPGWTCLGNRIDRRDIRASLKLAYLADPTATSGTMQHDAYRTLVGAGNIIRTE